MLVPTVIVGAELKTCMSIGDEQNRRILAAAEMPKRRPAGWSH
jgi:hypothetical protein